MASMRRSDSTDKEDKDLTEKEKEIPIRRMDRLLSQLGSVLLCSQEKV